MSLSYEVTNWENGKTVLKAEHLRKMEKGITDIISENDAIYKDEDTRKSNEINRQNVFSSKVNEVNIKILEVDKAKTDMTNTVSNKVDEIETRFNNLTSKQQQDAEVIDARYGPSDTEQHPTLGHRLNHMDDKYKDISSQLEYIENKTNWVSIKQYQDYATNIGKAEEDWSPAIQKAIDDNEGIIYFPKGNYKIRTTIRLKPSRTLIGECSNENKGTVLIWTNDDGSPAFDSDPLDFLGHFIMQDINIRTLITPGSTGNGNCFEIYAVTNNTSFIRVEVMYFRGNAWEIKRRSNEDGTLYGTDKNACANVYFNQCFVVSCGGYAFDIDGYVTAIWDMPDINSCVGGAFHFKNGVSNQANITINSLWWEGSRAWSSRQPILLENMGNQFVILNGCNFSGPSNGTSVVEVTGETGSNVALIGCTGYNYNAWVDNKVINEKIGYSQRITYFAEGILSKGVTLQGVAPFFDIYNVNGTQNKRRFRLQIAGTSWQLSSRNDSGGYVANILQATHGGDLEVLNYLKIGAVSKLPSPSSIYRGKVIRVEGSTGVSDELFICMKESNDTYSWKSI